MRFVATLSSESDGEGSDLTTRIVGAVGRVVAASGGAMWLHEEGTSFKLVARRNFSRYECGAGDAPVLAVWLVTHDDILDLGCDEHLTGRVDLPDWLPKPPLGRVLVPLHHRGWLIGFILLRESPASRHLDREDRELLRLVARSAASYVAEEEIGRRLREAQAFEVFTRRFAFVMHDLKNVAGQLRLTLSNARKHKRNPVFIDDMIDTIHAAANRMEQLIARMRGERPAPAQTFRVDTLVEEIVESCDDGRVVLARKPRRLCTAGDRDRLAAAVRHVLDNASQSSPAEFPVTVTVRAVGHDIRIEVSDQGHGMDELFVREHLYAPFTTTKAGGFGLGMTETREIIEQMHGRIDIDSEVGQGTTVRLVVPRIKEKQE